MPLSALAGVASPLATLPATSRSANITTGGNASLTLGACSQGGGKPGKWVMVTVQDNALLSTGTNSCDLNDISASGIGTTNRLNGGTFLVGGLIKSANFNVMYFNGGVLKAGANNTVFLPRAVHPDEHRADWRRGHRRWRLCYHHRRAVVA